MMDLVLPLATYENMKSMNNAIKMKSPIYLCILLLASCTDVSTSSDTNGVAFKIVYYDENQGHINAIKIYPDTTDRSLYLEVVLDTAGLLNYIYTKSNDKTAGPSVTMRDKGYEYSDGTLINGVMDGTWNFYSKKKKSKTITFDNGKKHGPLYLYDSFGNVSDTLVFKDGVEYNELD